MEKKPFEVVGTFSEIREWKRLKPDITLDDITTVARSRKFFRWYMRNKKAVHMLALVTPTFAMTLFGISHDMLTSLLNLPSEAISAMAPATTEPKNEAQAFFQGHGAILLHILLVGFLTLVITTFLKFTGRGDLSPLVVFVGGGIVLYEVLQLFKDIYTEVETFLGM